VCVKSEKSWSEKKSIFQKERGGGGKIDKDEPTIVEALSIVY